MTNEIHALAHVQREINTLIEENTAFISSGRASSYDDYQKVCGMIRGLSSANLIINDLVQKLEKSDD